MTPSTVYRFSRNWKYSWSSLGNSWRRSGKPDSIIEASIRITGSLVVASLTLSHVTATAFSAEEADEVSSSLTLDEVVAEVRSAHRIPVKNECLYGSMSGGLVDSLVLATSSGNNSFSGLLGPVG